MDIFGDDIDSYLEENNELNQNIRADSDAEDGEGNDGQNEDGEKVENDENGEPIKVEPKKRAVRKPQVNN